MIKVPVVRMPGNIIQIMPAPDNLYVVYAMGHEEEEEIRVLCLALTDTNKILKMVMDDETGHLEEARDAECFKCFRWK